MSETDYSYPGTELELFAHAVCWKRYWSSIVREYIRGDVLEVGAGFGSNTRWLVNRECRSWTAVEPDAALAARLHDALSCLPREMPRTVMVGKVRDVPQMRRFDTIVYVDVLEHIADDRQELALAAAHLNLGGRIVVLAPAHQWLFTPFDASIGHFRRYTRRSICEAAPQVLLAMEYWAYLDCVGILASLANRLVLTSARPTLQQVRAWDRILVPVSRWIVDPLLRRRCGKSLLVVWTRTPSDQPLQLGATPASYSSQDVNYYPSGSNHSSGQIREGN